MLIRIPACVAFATMLSGCGSSADPTSPTSPIGRSAAITIGIFFGIWLPRQLTEAVVR
jgi:hypothetical protein